MFQNEVKDHLTRLIETDSVPQSLLFAGISGDFPRTFAEMIANPADIHEYFPEGKVGMHSMESMRKFSDEVYLAPFNGKRKAFIIYDADRMLPASANALLKTFEEPAKSSVIILVSHNPSNLLPTIRSRCTVVRFQGTIAESAELPIIKILAQGRFRTYNELKEAAAAIGGSKDEILEAKKKELMKFPDNLTEAQKGAFEKEIDGQVAMYSASITHELFNAILSWYRDIQLLSVKGNHAYLMNPNYISELEKSKPIPLDKVQKILADAKLSHDRFTSLSMVMEKVFLELGFI